MQKALHPPISLSDNKHNALRFYYNRYSTMKRIFTYVTALILFAVLSSCDSDLERVSYNPDSVVKAQLSAINSNYTLLSNDAEQTAFTLRWSKPLVGFSASITSFIQMDIDSANFAHPITLSSSRTDTTFSISVSDLNNRILSLLQLYDKPIESTTIAIRIASSISSAADTLYSNTVTSTITPYNADLAYPFIAIRGDYNGWSFTESQRLYSLNSNHLYTGLIFFDGKASNGWKLSGTEDWSVDNWASPTTITPEQTPVTLVAFGADNISAYSKNSYQFTFDNQTGELTINNSFDSWGVVGTHNQWNAPDTPLTLSSETVNGVYTPFLSATLQLTAGNEFKIRADENWNTNLGPQDLSGTFEDAGNGNFTVSQTGTYTIKWYFNKAVPRIEVVKN